MNHPIFPTRFHPVFLMALPLLSLIAFAGDQTGGDGFSGELIAYYPLDGDATDASGNGHDGVLFGPTPMTMGGWTSSLRTNGVPSSFIATIKAGCTIKR